MSKGTSIQKLCECLNIDINKTVAIGDFNNDIPMFKVAKAGIAVANACSEALAAADYVTVSNEEHAIAQVIYDLEEGMYIQGNVKKSRSQKGNLLNAEFGVQSAE